MNDLQDVIDLDAIAAEVREHHGLAHAAAETAISHALRVGELLTDAKARIEHGAFGAFVESCGMSARQAQRYMRLHGHRDELPHDIGIRAALTLIGKSDTVSHLEQALELERRADRVRGALSRLSRALDAATTVEECIESARESEHLRREAVEIRVRAQRGWGQCAAELKALGVRLDADGGVE